MNALLISRISVSVLVVNVLASCESPRTCAQPVPASKVLYTAAKVQPHVDQPEVAKVERRAASAKHEGLFSRGFHGVAQALSVVGRIPALPATLMFGAIAGDEEALSSAG